MLNLDNDNLLHRLTPPSERISMVLDTDAYNEVDDQFALAYALASTEKLDVQAIYAAPFLNNRSESASDGMEKSYEEINRLLSLLTKPYEGELFRGSKFFLPSESHPAESFAAADLISRAKKHTPTKPLYVVAIGAITNIASALLMSPDIADKIVIVWLGGHPLYWPHTKEFNLQQDIHAANIVFSSKAAVVQIPCMGVASHLLTTKEDLKAHIGNKSKLCDALINLYTAYSENHFAYAKEIWDISTIAWLVNSDWVPSHLTHSPIVTKSCRWTHDYSRHLIRTADFVHRNAVFEDMFKKIISL